jgi:hypothetical protein
MVFYKLSRIAIPDNVEDFQAMRTPQPEAVGFFSAWLFGILFGSMVKGNVISRTRPIDYWCALITIGAVYFICKLTEGHVVLPSHISKTPA